MTNENQKIKFYNLKPVKDINIEIYEEVLDYCLNEKEVKNVAITGIYGAGKSSLLESYKNKKNLNNKFMHISLAHFIEENKKNEDQKINLFTLEAKILNQLIHQIPVEKIPQTNFKIKSEINKKWLFINSFQVTLFFICILYFKYFNKWEKYVNEFPKISCISFLLNLTINKIFILFLIILTIISFTIFCYNIIKKQRYRNLLKKLNIHGAEIEISEENTDSCFDKYLNEVLYLFEKSDVDVIIFEDIDRFEIQQIFERLREINILVNNRLEKNNKSLKFFYLLKDDIFISKERTKFFDFIIPVIPVIDSSNSYDEFLKIFENEKINKNFLEEVSLFIDDMRLLKNIYNEFKIYKGRLNNISLNLDKLLGMIIYKNLFPKDFADLQLNEGFIFSLFENKPKFIQNNITDINNRIEKFEHKINELETITYAENKKELQELKQIFLDYPYRNVNKTEWLSIKIPKFEELITKKENNEIEKLQSSINELNRQLKKIKVQPLAQIINVENINDIFNFNGNFKEVKENKYFNLLKYLVRKGYLDENYSDYMTYFYERSMKKTDKNFLLNVINYEKTNFDYKLENPEIIIKKLELGYFDKEIILNYDLFEKLLSPKNNDEKEKLERFLKALKNSNELNFIKEFFKQNRVKEKFINNLVNIWNNIFEEILLQDIFTSDDKHLFSIDLLYYCNDTTIEKINVNNILKNYIEEKSDYLKIENPKIEKLIEKFRLLDIKFKKIDYFNANKELFNEIYKNSMYALNISNLELILSTKNGIDLSDELITKNYTYVCKNKNSELYKYIDENINEYFKVILENASKINDEPETVIDVLNYENISDENKKEYIKLLETKITNISYIENKEFFDILVSNRKIDYNAKNIYTYFKEKGEEINDILIDFINSDNKILNFKEIEIEEKKKLVIKILECNDINNNNYKNILKNIGYYHYDNGDFSTSISQEKMDILIEENIVTMTEENLKYMRNSYDENMFYFIKKNIECYLKIIILNSNLFSKDELLKILEDREISDKQKLELLQISKEPISIKDKKYSVNIQKYILKNNYDNSDFEYLIINYKTYRSKNLKDCIFNLILENREEFCDLNNKIPDELLKEFLKNDKISSEEKLPILLNKLESINNIEEFSELLKLINLEEYKEIFIKNKTLKFIKNDFNTNLLNELLEKNYIKNIEEKDENTYTIETNDNN